MAAKRRSIVDFEKWIDGEIDGTEEAVERLEGEVVELTKRVERAKIRVEVLNSMKARLVLTEPADAEPEVEASPNVLTSELDSTAKPS